MQTLSKPMFKYQFMRFQPVEVDVDSVLRAGTIVRNNAPVIDAELILPNGHRIDATLQLTEDEWEQLEEILDIAGKRYIQSLQNALSDAR